MAMDAEQHDAPEFHLHSEDAGFVARCNDVFSSLDLLQSQHDALQKARDSSPYRKRDNDEGLWKDDPSIFETETIESRFKKPALLKPARTSRNTQKRKDPDKWVLYDLADVSDDQMNERSNTEAAYSFLDRKKLKLRDPGKDDDHSDDHNDQSKLTIKKHLFHINKDKTKQTVAAKASWNDASKIRLSLDEDSHVDSEDSGSTEFDTVGSEVEKGGTDVAFKSKKAHKSNIRTRCNWENDDDRD